MFRDVEQSAMRGQQERRDIVRQTRRESRSGQTELFSAEVLGSSYQEDLRVRYHDIARDRLIATLSGAGRVTFATLEIDALRCPMTGSQGVKRWLGDLCKQQRVLFEGMAPRQRVPRPDTIIVWQE